MSEYRKPLWHFDKVVFSGEDVTIVHGKGDVEFEEGDLLEIIYGSVTIYEGRVIDVWELDHGVPIVHLSATSVPSSGADYAGIARTKQCVESLLAALSDWERGEVQKWLSQREAEQ